MMAAHKVVLVGWDAADWKVIYPLIRVGKMPHLRRLVENGASGPIATLHPVLSPMLWTSIATGKRPFKHGILGFTEPTADGRGVQPISNRSRKSKALWNILHQNDLRSVVVGWWPSHPAEPIRGVMVSDRFHRANAPIEQGWPLAEGAVYPPDLAPRLADRRVHPDHLPPELIERFIPRAREIDQDQDKRLAGLLRTLAECLTIQSAASWLIEHEAWDFFAVYFEALDHFCHAFMRYYPPRQPWVGERDFEIYQNVVAASYQMLDEMLGALLEKAGEVTVLVISDHGFHPDHLRPMSIPDIPAGPSVEHRDFGIFAIRGRGVRKNAQLTGASILDVTPTVLALFGLPAGEDMDGKVLTQAFLETPRIASVPSWEEIPGADGRHPPEACVEAIGTGEIADEIGHEMMDQMVALGYIERPAQNRTVAVEKTVRELRYNLAQAYQDAGRHPQALEILTRLEETCPDEVRFAIRRFVSCQALGRHEDMRRIAGSLKRHSDLTPLAAYLEAQVSISERRYSEAVAALEEISRDWPVAPDLLSQTGDLYFLQHRHRPARQSYERALALDPDHIGALLGLTRLAIKQGDFHAGAHLALDALNRANHSALAHFLLARALVGIRKYTQAADAFRSAISCNPHFPEAHLGLARLYETQLGNLESAREHRRLARAMEEKPVGAAQSGGEQYVVVVTGLPRSGTSMLMQMLAAGGIPVLSDHLRQPDEDNPRGYFEFEPVKRLSTDGGWLASAQGKAVKIVVPLLAALPPAIPCRVIFCRRDPDEILDSQECMLRRNKRTALVTPERRETLKQQYAQCLKRAEALLRDRPGTHVLTIDHATALSNPLVAAEKIRDFLGASVDVARMASVIDSALYRHHVLYRH
jgi:predicted AlkP superfamily phosphohydrolase/phosphomutase/Tfp pilus assembly protein PilF